MKTLIVLGHPNFEKSIANKAIMEELQNSNLDIEVRNLENLYPNYGIDAKAEQEILLKHQNIVFQYPLYWYNMPAILKHWFDVVFEYQFAFGSKGDKLKDKNFVTSITVGGSEKDYQALAKHHFRVYEFSKNLEQTAYFAQMKYIEPVYLYKTSLADGYREDEIKDKAKDHAKRLILRLAELN